MAELFQQTYSPVAGSILLSAIVASIPPLLLALMLAVWRFAPWKSAIAGATSAALLAWLVWGMPFGLTLTTTALFCICLGVGHGLFAVGRNTLPLILFGAKQYGYYMGLLMVPQNIVNAASPIIFAAAISRVHPAAALIIAGVGAVTGFGAVVALIRACRGHGAVHPG